MRTLYDSKMYESKWCLKINDILNKAGLPFIWNLDEVNPLHLKRGLKLRLSDIEMQEWATKVNENVKS